MIPTLEWLPEGVNFLDQTKLPLEETYVLATDYKQVATVIRDMIVRGAPAIGVSAAMGMAIGIDRSAAATLPDLTAEVAIIARTLAETKQYAAIITLGVLLRGETAHYEAIYNEVARGIGQSQQETGIPHAFGVLTCETLEQALDRAGLKAGNKGFEAAIAAIEMASIQQKLSTKTEANS